MQIKATRIILLLSQVGDPDAQRDLCEHEGGPPTGCEKGDTGRTNAAIHFTDREAEDQQKRMLDRIASLGRSKHLQTLEPELDLSPQSSGLGLSPCLQYSYASL